MNRQYQDNLRHQYERVFLLAVTVLEDGSVDMTIWVSEAEIAKLLAKSGSRIVIK